ncbi:hypothetical protein GQ43DRAFT_385796 [Delitschia confertaspora ATCC 74209]|uniref:NUC153 domain-containing protein n=1 Tax=Delitschia confertaspora ATCC 74209 TaxID=1513339 RepID=A0A9P4JUS2_9PLEO|nr:hypothetical protein GQ43DRAFT_385796 [Delitschia confertaspora ATCC 74209]
MPLPPRQKVPKGRPAQDGPTITDPRFANIQTDPRFRLPSKKHTKTKLDARFAHMLKDKEFSQKASVDKYGRKIQKDAGKKELERFYRVEDEDQDESEEETAQDKAVRKELAKANAKERDYDPIRDGGFTSSSSEESDSDSDDEEEEEPEVEDETELAEQKSEIPMGEVTKRLAAVNMDWDNIRAQDIMAVASSFVEGDNRILNVTIYPSEFGLQRLQREEIEGPPREIFASSSSKTDLNKLTSDDEAGSGSDDEVDEDEIKKDLLKESNGEEFDSKALRAYQLDRLRYYYAVIECSSLNAAKSIYDNLDGREYLSSANFFDLRFIPDEVTFDEKPHDECDKLPDAYRPNEFTTDALTHSKVKLTWDAEDTQRKEAQKRAFSRKEIEENDLQAYLGSDSSSSEDEADNEKAKKAAALRAALGLGSEPAPSKSKSKSEKKDRDFKKPDGEMQITFTAGLSTSGPNKSVFENEPIIEETTAEKYIRLNKERKARRKARAQAIREGRDPDEVGHSDEEGDKGDAKEAEDGDPWNDPFFGSDPEESKRIEKELKKSKKQKEREERDRLKKESDAQRAELELLMIDDKQSNIRHFDMNEIMKAEKAAKKKKGKGKRSKGEDVPVIQDDFKVDTQDPRFSKLFESHEFAIDPTNPRFKGTEGMKALLEEGRKKRKHQRDEGEVDGTAPDKKVKKERSGEADGDISDLKKLAARVKARSKKV